jgi:hypothetical protein
VKGWSSGFITHNLRRRTDLAGRTPNLEIHIR